MNNNSLSDWFDETDFGQFGSKVVLAHDLFVDYVYYCKKNGVENKDIATARQMSDYLEESGYEKKRICTGMAFVIIS